MQAVTIGPWMFPMGLVAIVLGWAAASFVAWLLKRRRHADAGTPLWVLLVAALVAARVAYVAGAWSAYAAEPAGILDIRDGGFSWIAGVVVLLLGVAWWAWRRPRLRRPLVASAGAGLALWAAVAFGAPRIGGSDGAYPPLPAVALQRLDGQPVRLAAFTGKPMVVNIWATWCGPCRSEMPMLAAASRELTGVRFVFADHGESAATVAGYLQRSGLHLPNVVLDPEGTLMHDYRLPGCPATLFVDAAGTVRQVHLGPLSAAALRADVARL